MITNVECGFIARDSSRCEGNCLEFFLNNHEHLPGEFADASKFCPIPKPGRTPEAAELKVLAWVMRTCRYAKLNDNEHLRCFSFGPLENWQVSHFLRRLIRYNNPQEGSADFWRDYHLNCPQQLLAHQLFHRLKREPSLILDLAPASMRNQCKHYLTKEIAETGHCHVLGQDLEIPKISLFREGIEIDNILEKEMIAGLLRGRSAQQIADKLNKREESCYEPWELIYARSTYLETEKNPQFTQDWVIKQLLWRYENLSDSFKEPWMTYPARIDKAQFAWRLHHWMYGTSENDLDGKMVKWFDPYVEGSCYHLLP